MSLTEDRKKKQTDEPREDVGRQGEQETLVVGAGKEREAPSGRIPLVHESLVHALTSR